MVTSARERAAGRRVDVDAVKWAQECRERLRNAGLPLDGAPAEGEPQTTKKRILETAITLFAERGFEACTMRDLASAVGIKAPAIYNHYASKDIVLAEAMQQILGRFFAYVLEGLEGHEPGEWLECIVRHHILFQLTHPRHARANDALMGAPSTERNLPRPVYRRIVGAERAYVELIRAAILVRAPGMDHSDALFAAFAITAAGDRVATWYDPAGPLSPDEIADRHWALLSQLVDGHRD